MGFKPLNTFNLFLSTGRTIARRPPIAVSVSGRRRVLSIEANPASAERAIPLKRPSIELFIGIDHGRFVEALGGRAPVRRADRRAERRIAGHADRKSTRLNSSH